MLEHTDIPREPAEMMREQVILLRGIQQTLQDLQTAQTKTAEEFGLLTAAMQTRSERSRVKLTGLDLPISTLILFMLKWVVASIPVILIVGLVGGAVGGLIWYALLMLGYI